MDVTANNTEFPTLKSFPRWPLASVSGGSPPIVNAYWGEDLALDPPGRVNWDVILAPDEPLILHTRFAPTELTITNVSTLDSDGIPLSWSTQDIDYAPQSAGRLQPSDHSEVVYLYPDALIPQGWTHAIIQVTWVLLTEDTIPAPLSVQASYALAHIRT